MSQKLTLLQPIRPKGEKIGADEVQCVSIFFCVVYYPHLHVVNALMFIQVQNHIEKCLQLYMNQNEVIAALHLQANIEPGFTSLGMGTTQHLLILLEKVWLNVVHSVAAPRRTKSRVF